MRDPITSERFWATVDIKSEDECWEWKASKHRQGYGMLRVHNKKTYAHRYALLGDDCLFYKDHILHTCDNPPCCNPKHLYRGTHQDNMNDRDKRDYDRRNLNARTLKDGEVWLIRKLLIEGRNLKYHDIGKLFRVTDDTIKRIKWRKTYKEIFYNKGELL